VSPKRGERVAPPAADGEWDLIYGTNEAAKGWGELCQQAPSNTLAAWRIMRANPAPTVQTDRHHRLKGSLSTGTHQGEVFDQWQIEATGGGRIWYLVDEERHRVILKLAGTGHPKATD
jgi:hypothetical protein